MTNSPCLNRLRVNSSGFGDTCLTATVNSGTTVPSVVITTPLTVCAVAACVQSMSKQNMKQKIKTALMSFMLKTRAFDIPLLGEEENRQGLPTKRSEEN